MATYLINGFSAKSGGGKAVLDTFLSELVTHCHESEDTYYILTANPTSYSLYESRNLHIIHYANNLTGPIGTLKFYFLFLRRIVRTFQIDGILNFGDIVLPLHNPQVYFFDWAYFVYPRSIVWRRMGFRDYFVRSVKYYAIKFTLGYASLVVAQTPTMIKRLKLIHGVKNLEVVPSPVGFVRSELSEQLPVHLPYGRRLLICLSNYASHKNMDVLLQLAQTFKENGDNFLIVTTLDAQPHSSARQFLDKIDQQELTDYLHNIGTVDSSLIQPLLSRCDALILPTLLESYGLPLVEAMACRLTVITSDFDFLRDVAGGAGYYFDPHAAQSIYLVVKAVFDDEELRQSKIEEGLRIVDRLGDSKHSFNGLIGCLRRVSSPNLPSIERSGSTI